MKPRLIPGCIALFTISSCAYGAVILQDSYAAGAPGGAATNLSGGAVGYEINLDPATEFSAAGHDKLVLGFTGHDGQYGSGYTTITNVTYDGVKLKEAIFDRDDGELVEAGIFYLDNVKRDGTLRIELDRTNQMHYGFSLYALDGVKPGVQDTGTAIVTLSDATVTISTSTGFFVQEAVRNNQSLAGDVGDHYETLYNYSVDSYRGLSQYQLTTTPGDYLAPIGNTGIHYRRVVTAAFEAKPGTVVFLR